MKQLRERIVAEKICEDPDVYTDVFLLSYCRARKFDIEKVMLMFTNFIKWKKENDVDDIEVN
jgi:hypothetical protein